MAEQAANRSAKSTPLPAQQLWSLLLGRDMQLRVFEDNSATLTVVEAGYSPQLRHLLKIQKCSIDLVHRLFHVLRVGELEHIPTTEQTADIFTKSLSGPGWIHALQLLHVELGERFVSNRM